MAEATVDRLHPGVHVALARGRMDEAQLARAIAAGELTSPQPYGNSWFFNLRITGTGSSYRRALDEYVWRDPSIYMNQGFLDRCNGLPVVIMHPSKSMLDTKEYAERNIGSIVYAYLREDVNEVWGIARILDMPAAKFMRTHQLSTSPAVVFLPNDGNQKIEMGDGEHLLIEGKPSLLDHLAVCEEGVWDNGGPPVGVDVTGETEVTMPDNVKNDADRRDATVTARKDADDDKRNDNDDEKARKDADARRDEQIDDILKGIKVIGDRMDSFEDRFKKDRQDDDGDKDKKETPAEKAVEKMDADENDKDKKADASKKDDDPETEKRQAAELRRLAEEEEKEAAKGDKKADADDDKDKRDDRADRQDSVRFRDDDSEVNMPFEEAARKRGESDQTYARRVDALAKRHDAVSLQKSADESTAAYCDRVDAAVRRDRGRKDAIAKFDSIETIADQVRGLGTRLEDFTRRFEDRTPEDEESFADAQARADDAYSAFGDRAPRPLRGENLVGYRIRLARGLQKHSDLWKDSDLGSIARADTNAFENVERTIYADASNAARNPSGVPMGQLREIKKRLPTGVEISEFAGDPLAWMGSFMAPGRAAKRLVTRPFHERA